MAGLDFLVLAEIAMHGDPVFAGRMQADLLSAIVLLIVRPDEVSRRVDEVAVENGPLQHFIRRAFEAKRPGFDDRLVDGDRPYDAHRLDRALDRRAGVENR